LLRQIQTSTVARRVDCSVAAITNHEMPQKCSYVTTSHVALTCEQMRQMT